MEQKKSLVLLNFSGVYEKQDFYKKCMERGARCVDLRGIPGTNCYCDQESEEKIKEQLMVSGVKGIHYLDSGNYHYVTKLWMDLIREPFDLLVFDHHTDLQPPFFGDILSCGGWIREALRRNGYLSNLYLAGPPCIGEELWEEETREFPGRILGIREEELKFPDRIREHLESSDRPLYISLDKDILAPSQCPTNWDQGEAALEEILGCMEAAFSSRPVLAVDVCGEPEAEENGEWGTGQETSGKVNERILHYLEKVFWKFK